MFAVTVLGSGAAYGLSYEDDGPTLPGGCPINEDIRGSFKIGNTFIDISNENKVTAT